MVENSALEDDSVLQALRDEPRKINGGVDTNRGEDCSRINARAKIVFRNWAELSKYL